MEIKKGFKRVFLVDKGDLGYLLETLESNLENAKRIKEEAEGIVFSLRRLKENIERVLEDE